MMTTAHAAKLVAQGASLIPIIKDTKKPAVSWEQFQSRRATIDEVQSWLSAGHELGMVTGKVSGVTVIDVDPMDDGSNNPYSASPTAFQTTPRGGKHYLYRYAEGVKNSASKVAPHVDVRGEGGYIKLYEPICLALLADFPLSIPEGSRNQTLTSIAGKAARVGADVKTAVESANELCTPPLAAGEVASIVKSAAKWADDAVTMDIMAARFNHNNDYAFNERLNWLKWTGSRWKQIEATEVKADIIKWTQNEITTAVTRSGTGDLIKRLNSIRSNPHSLLSVLEAVSFVPFERFGDDKNVLNVKNGLIDLKTGKLAPHSRSYSLHQAEVEYDETAQTEEFDAFLKVIIPDDELRHYIKVSMGYACTGLVTEEIMHLWLGGGKNGKSTLANVITTILGDYIGELPASVLGINHRAGDNQPHLATQLGKRILFANEPAEGLKIDDATIKELCSRDRMQVAQKYALPFQMSPSWLLIVRGNHRPQIGTVDDGMWRRVKEVPFSVKIEKPDKTIGERIIHDNSKAVIRWLVEGAIEYNKTGLPFCKAVEDASNNYRSSSDTRQQWFNDSVTVSSGSVKSADAYTSYVNYCKLQRLQPVSRASLSHWLIGKAKYDATLKSFLGIDVG